MESGVEETMYSVIAAPPSLVGAVQDTTAEESWNEDARTRVGAPGTPAGVAVAEDSDAIPVPARFVAVTVNV
jgi:hypothetical protein